MFRHDDLKDPMGFEYAADSKEMENALKRVEQIEINNLAIASEETPRMALKHHKECVRNWNRHRKLNKKVVKP